MSGVTSLGLFPHLVTQANAVGLGVISGSVIVTGVNTGLNNSAWGQVSASLAEDVLVTKVTVETASSTLSSTAFTTVDIGIGGAGSEAVIATVPLTDTVLISASNIRAGAGKVDVPSRVAGGQRLAVRIHDTGGNLGGINVTIRLWGVPFGSVEAA